MSEHCARWIALADRIAVGDELVPLDAEFLRRHASACEACAAEARIYDELEGLLKPRAAKVAPPPAQGERARRSPIAARVVTAGAGALAMAAAIALFVRARTASAPQPSAPAPQAQGQAPTAAPLASTSPAVNATVTLVEGQASLSGAGATLASGAVLETGRGRACIRLEADARTIRVCLGESTRVRVEQLDGPARVLRLEKGHVAAELEPQPPGTSFAIATRDGSVMAIGTAFSVEVTDDAPPVARVTHGVVLVRAAHDEKQLHAHYAARFGEAARLLRTDEEDVDRTLLREGAAPQAKHPARVTLDTAPAGVAVRIDGVLVGVTPLDVLVEPGKHSIQVDGLDSVIPINLGEGERFSKSWPAAPAAASVHVRAPSRSSAAAGLLAAAQAARAAGEVDRAARAYRELLAAHPRSREADTAALSLGQIELGRGAATEALALFDRYVAAGGPLALEARFGRIGALRALGRTSEERAAVDAFLRDYDGTPQADALRARKP